LRAKSGPNTSSASYPIPEVFEHIQGCKKKGPLKGQLQPEPEQERY